MIELIILGAGGNCIDILDTVNELNERGSGQPYKCVGFLDDDREKWGDSHFGARVLGPVVDAHKYDTCMFVNGIGSPDSFWRKPDIISRAKIPLTRFATIVHPSASVSRMSNIGRRTVVFLNVSITSNVTIGNHVVVLPNSIVSHDVSIGDYSCIAGGVCVSGNVSIGESCYLGTNCAIKGWVTVGDKSLVGMGCVVKESIPSNCVVAGNPGRFLRQTIP